jgi:hypothetical protein
VLGRGVIHRVAVIGAVLSYGGRRRRTGRPRGSRDAVTR